jgi:hypothetical protein
MHGRDKKFLDAPLPRAAGPGSPTRASRGGVEARSETLSEARCPSRPARSASVEERRFSAAKR